jgi:hypothetical protein
MVPDAKSYEFDLSSVFFAFAAGRRPKGAGGFLSGRAVEPGLELFSCLPPHIDIHSIDPAAFCAAVCR